MKEKKIYIHCHYTIDNTLEITVYTEEEGKEKKLVERVFDREEPSYREKLRAFYSMLKAHFEGYELLVNDWYD